MEKERFAILVCVKVILIEKEIIDDVKSNQQLKNSLVAGRTTKVFFVVPDSSQKDIFINSDFEFQYNDFGPFNSLRLTKQNAYFNTENIQRLFLNLEFEKYNRSEWCYKVLSIGKSFIPFTDLDLLQNRADFMV